MISLFLSELLPKFFSHFYRRKTNNVDHQHPNSQNKECLYLPVTHVVAHHTAQLLVVAFRRSNLDLDLVCVWGGGGHKGSGFDTERMGCFYYSVELQKQHSQGEHRECEKVLAERLTD